MNQVYSLSELTDNLVPFTAHRVMSSLIWCNNDVRDEEKLKKSCSYIISLGSVAPSKVFYAERYGGSGIQRNGGGARCGFDGRYQIKGIGANPLVGQGTDGRHSNGALGAVHAVYEALWGDALEQILPYGAVRTEAILLTNIYSDKVYDITKRKSRRALMIRDPVVRPAHFERAPYFRPQQKYAAELIHDAQRVRSVISMLPANLPLPGGGPSEDAKSNLRLYCIEGLCELARREAWQMAFCRTRFLRLTTSPSNIAMDGRLMDFNGLSCLFPGNYPNDFGQQLRLNELMKEPMVLQQGLVDLCLYLGKYSFDHEFTLFARQEIEFTFQNTFREACYYCYLELLGIPVELLPKEDIPDVLKQLVDSFIVLLNNQSYMLYHQESDKKDDSPLQKMAIELARCSCDSAYSFVNHAKNDVNFTNALICFTQGIHWLIQTCIKEEENFDIKSLLTHMEQHIRKRLQPRKCLEKIYMYEKIADLLDEHSDDHFYLREAFSVMGARMQFFSKEAFGHISPFRFTL
ncbi:MchC protein [Salmonella enterica subsp. enterica serovar Javiana]|nr:MchC protein [Salmonella enterica]EDS5050638.1 MchC protein [Salmonella enterica subsp. enterica serovar Javiana]ECP1439703.1 MchC protein [Salmonella enterica]EDU2246193.1 MchC protein [Salmonella enterica subsp. enterica serovar Javiana]EDX4344600.1 MchC protein [Salmonella enterica subsp. enterica serovar Javiana]